MPRGWHILRVQVKRPGLQISDKIGYDAGTMANAPEMETLSLGNRIKLARQTASQRLMQADLAEAAGVSVDSMSDYETDKTWPPSDVIRAICEGTGVSADWLLFGTTRRYLSGIPSLQAVPGSGHPDPDRPRQRPLLVPVRKT